jgi:MSHA biogenesis protein MshQ
VASISAGAFATGAGTVTLAAPNAAGSVDLVIRLNSTLGMCPAWVPAYPAGTPTSVDFLRGKWCGAAYDKDPVARATFSIYGSNRQIYLREGF